jgi:hypothetical protein
VSGAGFTLVVSDSLTVEEESEPQDAKTIAEMKTGANKFFIGKT